MDNFVSLINQKSSIIFFAGIDQKQSNCLIFKKNKRKKKKNDIFCPLVKHISDFNMTTEYINKLCNSFAHFA